MDRLIRNRHVIEKLLRRADDIGLSHQAKQRLKLFSYALKHSGNISLTCRHFGIARSTFLRWAERFEARDESSLEERSRCPKKVREPKTDVGIIERIRALRLAYPTQGKQRIAHILAMEGMHVSASTVGRVIARHALFFAPTPSHRAKRSYGRDQSECNADPFQQRLPLPDDGPATALPPALDAAAGPLPA